jgi:hypothetical protein
MANIPEQIVDNIFPEERNRLVTFLKRQKRNLRAWLIALTLLALAVLVVNYLDVLRYLVTNSQSAIDAILALWIIAIVIVPFIWPQKPGSVFSENFEKGINPRIWEYEGDWKTELDENGKPVLSITNSEIGGLAIPCLSWTDYELQFDTRIMNQCTTWLMRASSLNDCFMIQITPELIRPHFRASGLWQLVSSEPHGLPIKIGEWFSIRTLVRGAWVTVYITLNGKEHLVYQKRILGTRPPMSVHVQLGDPENGEKYSQILVVSARIGSFGFRFSGVESAQFRNIKTYKLK